MFRALIIIISLLLDGLFSLYFSKNSYFLPLLTLTSLYITYNPQSTNKQEMIFLTATGLIYDLLYTNLIFYHAIVLNIVGLIIKYFHKNYSQNIITTIFFLSIIITIYESINQLLFFMFGVIPFSLTRLIYKISHSLILNIIFAIIILLLKKRIKKTIKA